MAAFDFAKVKDPTFFKENVLNAHASFRTYASREEYLAGESSLAMKLDGIWKFAYAKNYTSAIPGFEKTDYDCSGWDDIHVPAHIQMEGYDIPCQILPIVKISELYTEYPQNHRITAQRIIKIPCSPAFPRKNMRLY